MGIGVRRRTIYHDREHPSHLLLPILQADEPAPGSAWISR
jgi:hypothetical protein